MLDIIVQTERPYIQIDGVKEYCPPQIAQLAAAILGARGEIVPTERLISAARTNKDTVWVLIYELRKIFERHDYHLSTVLRTGVRLTKPVQPEYTVKSPKKF